MKRTHVALLVSLALAAMLAAGGCAGQPASQSEVRVTAADNGSTKTLSAGQTLVVELTANPSTGYTWAVDGQPPAQLKQLSEPTYTAGDSKVVGSAGTQTFRFGTVSKGSGTLKMKYWRSFEPTTPPAQTFELGVDVR